MKICELMTYLADKMHEYPGAQIDIYARNGGVTRPLSPGHIRVECSSNRQSPRTVDKVALVIL